MKKLELTLEKIKAARSRIHDFVKRTPLIRSETLSQICDGEVFLKLENQQHTNSFKIRGALNRMSQLSPTERERGVVTASSGNHAQAVALAAQHLGIDATIVVPRQVSEAKMKKIRTYDVEVILEGDYNEVESAARRIAQKEGKAYISPYNDIEIMAGQGTVVLEILEDLENIDTIIVPVGGGGLISGIAVAAKSVRPNMNVIGVQTYTTATMFHSIRAGQVVKFEEGDTLAEAFLGGIEEGALTFDIIMQHVDDIVLVGEDRVAEAMRILWREEKQIVEGAGATAICPILEAPRDFRGQTVVATISGGNIEEELFKSIVNRT